MYSYKSKIANRYLPVDAAQIGLKIAESESYWVSVKHDGHLAFLSVKKGKAELFDRNGDAIKVPSILKAASSIKEDVVLAGELCLFDKDNSTSHREVSSALADPDASDLRFGIFDVLEYKDKTEWDDFKEKFELISKLSGDKELFAIEQKFYESRKDIISFFDEVADKAEGIIVRAGNNIIYKVKKVHHLDLVVLGYAESTGDREGFLRELLLGFALGEGRYQIVTKCGSGFSEDERKSLLQQFEKLQVESEYTEVSGAKTAFVMIKPETVVEISCLDLINETTYGPIQKACLVYDDKKGYLNEGQHNTLSIISPNFTRIRTDKKANEKDAGTQQAYSLKPPLEEKTSAASLKPSEIILREVYTKDGKGGTAVRKFVGMKTHKESTGLYAPYVVVYTDFSGGRKTPMEQEIYLCQSEKEVSSVVAELKTENIKKGWEQVK